MVCLTASAEVLSLLNGRGANLQNSADVSADAGIVVADDYQYIGGRINYKIAPNIVAFGDLGQAENFAADGLTFGARLFYQIDGLFENTDTAVKVSYHTTELEVDRFEFHVSNLTIQFLVNGDKLG